MKDKFVVGETYTPKNPWGDNIVISKRTNKYVFFYDGDCRALIRVVDGVEHIYPKIGPLGMSIDYSSSRILSRRKG
jgi:hypothetical protein